MSRWLVSRWSISAKPAAELDARLVERGDKALDTMERLLAGKRYFVGERLSVADIVLLPYTRMAHEGGFDLASRTNVERVDRALRR